RNNYVFGGYDMEVAGITLASVFGALGGSAVTVGPILWQLGASQETRLRNGDFELLGSVRNRRLAGSLLIGVGVLGEIVAIVGGGMLAAGTSIDDEGGTATRNHTGDVGVDLIFAGSAVAVLGCTIGGTLLTTAGRDQKLAIALAPGGLRMTF
ncbi:MAG TPA: hypothetical protein VHB97_08190, partial [Polyangia bacterium]|nr:hypothetical protein [Polyangia bacterium]